MPPGEVARDLQSRTSERTARRGSQFILDPRGRAGSPIRVVRELHQDVEVVEEEHLKVETLANTVVVDVLPGHDVDAAVAVRVGAAAEVWIADFSIIWVQLQVVMQDVGMMGAFWFRSACGKGT